MNGLLVWGDGIRVAVAVCCGLDAVLVVRCWLFCGVFGWMRWMMGLADFVYFLIIEPAAVGKEFASGNFVCRVVFVFCLEAGRVSAVSFAFSAWGWEGQWALMIVDLRG